MYLPQLDLIVMEVPKTGTRTLVKAAKLADRTIECYGHRQHSYIIDWIDKRYRKVPQTRTIAVYRDPVERFLSGLNFLNKKTTAYDPDMAMANIRGHYSKIETVFKPQSYYLDTSFVVDLYGMTQHQEIIKMIGVEEHIHENKSKPLYSMDDLKPYIPDIQDFYEQDYQLPYLKHINVMF